MRVSMLAAGLCLVALSGCATPESRVRASLIDIGLPESTSSCMAENVATKLSSQQIKALSKMSGISTGGIGKMTIGEFTRLLARSDNGDMLQLFVRAGVGCAVIG